MNKWNLTEYVGFGVLWIQKRAASALLIIWVNSTVSNVYLIVLKQILECGRPLYKNMIYKNILGMHDGMNKNWFRKVKSDYNLVAVAAVLSYWSIVYFKACFLCQCDVWVWACYSSGETTWAPSLEVLNQIDRLEALQRLSCAGFDDLRAVLINFDQVRCLVGF